MNWSTVQFGKHKGKTLPQILFSDPDWFFWAIEVKAFDKKGILLQESDELFRKATNIKIPDNSDGMKVVEYLIHQPTGKFSHFEIVPTSRPLHKGSSQASRLHVVDMSFPRTLSNYDKLGCQHLLTSLKFHIFGNKSVRMTKKRCEDFFDNSENFV